MGIKNHKFILKNNCKYDNLNIESKGGSKLNNTELKPRRWLLVVLFVIAIVIVVVLLNKIITDHKERQKNKPSNGISDIINNQLGKGNDMFDTFEKESFNSKFEFRTGQNYGSTVMKLFDDVITNNKKNQDHIITVAFGETSTSNPDELKNTKKNLDEWTKYEISVDYDENGYVNKITVEK